MTNLQMVRELSARIPPKVPRDVVAGTKLNSCYGPSIALPDDYLMFLETYGPGDFTEGWCPALAVHDLISSPTYDHVQILLQCAQEGHEAYPDTHPPVYPHAPGLLPWGTFDQGYTFYWWVDGPPNSWRVVVDPRRDLIWYEYSMLEFLYVNLTAAPGKKFFDDGIERFTGFCPASKYSEAFEAERRRRAI